jgi:hypothetical protein
MSVSGFPQNSPILRRDRQRLPTAGTRIRAVEKRRAALSR